MQDQGLTIPFVRAYGLRFCEGLSKECENNNHPTDLHEQVALDVDMSRCVVGNFVWLGAHAAMMNFMESKPSADESTKIRR